jgi:glycosyltransferase involved in cell wall biosynthesis
MNDESLMIVGLGFVLLTFGLGSLLAGVFLNKKISIKSAEFPANLPKIAILIPAHNEAKKLGNTLFSIENELLKNGWFANVQIGLDSCNDESVSVLENLRDSLTHLKIQVFSVQFRSKWLTLKSLLSSVSLETDWVLLVDAGTSWREGLLTQMLPYLQNNLVMGVAPAYEIEGASRLTKLFWQVERSLKSIENLAQGTVSVHGATVAYRARHLGVAFAKLAEDPFKNDDVILPLSLRIFFPAQSIHYLKQAVVFDRAQMEDLRFKTQLIRRKRMVLGNLQWIRWFCAESFRVSVPFSVWAVALRRVLRPFWVWWFLILATFSFPKLGNLGLLVLAPIFLFPTAALASAYAPFALLLGWDKRKALWR